MRAILGVVLALVFVGSSVAEARKGRRPLKLPYGVWFTMTPGQVKKALKKKRVRYRRSGTDLKLKKTKVFGARFHTGEATFLRGRLEALSFHRSSLNNEKSIKRIHARLKRTLKRATGRRGKLVRRHNSRELLWKHRGIEVKLELMTSNEDGATQCHLVLSKLSGYRVPGAKSGVPACEVFIGRLNCLLRKYTPKQRKAIGPVFRKSIRQIRQGVRASKTRAERAKAATDCRKGSASLRRKLWKVKAYRPCLR